MQTELEELIAALARYGERTKRAVNISKTIRWPGTDTELPSDRWKPLNMALGAWRKELFDAALNAIRQAEALLVRGPYYRHQDELAIRDLLNLAVLADEHVNRAVLSQYASPELQGQYLGAARTLRTLTLQIRDLAHGMPITDRPRRKGGQEDDLTRLFVANLARLWLRVGVDGTQHVPRSESGPFQRFVDMVWQELGLPARASMGKRIPGILNSENIP